MNEIPACPADHVSVNEHKTRVVAFFVLLESAAGICAGCYVYTIFRNMRLVQGDE